MAQQDKTANQNFWLDFCLPFIDTGQNFWLEFFSKRMLFHPNTDVRFVRQIIDGPDRVRGVKEMS